MIIEQNMEKYQEANTKIAKSILVTSIVDTIVDNAKSSGCFGFVRQDPKTKQWYEVGEKQARDKVG